MSQPDPARQIDIHIGKMVNAAAFRPLRSKRGRILMPDTTHELMKGSFACKARGPVDLHGSNDAVMTWWVSGNA